MYKMWCILCYGFDIHSTFSRVDDHIALPVTVCQDRHIEFLALIILRNVGVFCNKYLTHEFAWACHSTWCLRSFQHHADDVACLELQIFNILHHFDTTTFSSSTCVQL